MCIGNLPSKTVHETNSYEKSNSRIHSYWYIYIYVYFFDIRYTIVIIESYKQWVDKTKKFYVIRIDGMTTEWWIRIWW